MENKEKKEGESHHPEERSRTVKPYKGSTLERARENPWMITSIILAIILVLIVVFGTTIFGNKNKDLTIVSGETAGENLIKFINAQGKGTATFEKAEIEDGLYKITVKYNNNDVPVLVTLDGNSLVVYPPISLSPEAQASSDTGEESAPIEIPKTDKPLLELFVWAFCPGGVYGESVITPVVGLLKDKIDAKVRFIGPVTTNKEEAATSCFAGQSVSMSSTGKIIPEKVDDGINECCISYNYTNKTYYSCALHNKKDNHLESEESERQACILNEYGVGKLLSYTSEFNNECIAKQRNAADFASCWKSLLTKNNLSVEDVTKCVSTKEGLKLLIADYEYGLSLGGIHQSPSYFVNGAEVSSSSPDALKTTICSAFNSVPRECSQTAQASQSASSSGTGASCGS
jgi:hypothetical protein